MPVSFRVRDSVRVIQVAILSCNCEATQPRRKIKAHGRRSALKTKPRDSVWSFQTSVYFNVYKVAMRTNSRSLVATIIP